MAVRSARIERTVDMFRLHTRAVAVAFAVSGCAVLASANSFGLAAMAANTGGLAQFSTWPVPLYTSNVKATLTYAPNSYGIDTSDSPDHVLAWYRAKLKSRAMAVPPHSTSLRQLLVDGGSYVINVSAGSGTTSINVIKN
jgi:hypothetical protein